MSAQSMRPWIAAWVLAAAQSLQAALPPASDEGSIGQSPQEMLQRKQQLIYQMLTKSPIMERAARSDNPQAKQYAARAQTLYAEGGSALSAGNTVQAEKQLNEALRMILALTHLVPDPIQADAARRTRYAELVRGIEDFQTAHQAICNRLAPTGGPSPAIAADLERVHELMAKAHTLAGANRYDEANTLLADAHETVVATLNKMLASTTLVYGLKFGSAVEEFNYEIARYRSYEELMPVAYAELKPGTDAVKRSGQLVEESHGMRITALKQAATGNYRSAVNTLQEATAKLQGALRVTGLVVPNN